MWSRTGNIMHLIFDFSRATLLGPEAHGCGAHRCGDQETADGRIMVHCICSNCDGKRPKVQRRTDPEALHLQLEKVPVSVFHVWLCMWYLGFSLWYFNYSLIHKLRNARVDMNMFYEQCIIYRVPYIKYKRHIWNIWSIHELVPHAGRGGGSFEHIIYRIYFIYRSVFDI